MATCVFFVALLVGIVDYGAVGIETRSVLALAVFAVLCLSTLAFGLPVHTRRVLIVAALLMLSVFLVVFVQTTPLPGWVPPSPSWAAAAPFSGQTRALISLTPADDRLALVGVALPFGFLMAGLVLFDTDERAMRALQGMAAAGGVIALWSLLQFLFLPDTLVFGEKRFYHESLTSFFVNRNTAATFLGLIALTQFALFWRAAAALDWRWLVQLLDSDSSLLPEQKRLIRRAFVMGGLLAVSFIALMLTLSRGGIGASFAGFALFAVVMLVTRLRRTAERDARHSRRRVAAAVVAIAALLLVFLLFAGQTILRAEMRGLEDSRFCVMPGILAAIADHWPWGSGLASFEDAYAPYHDADCSINAVFKRAHNVYLEGLLTLGMFFPPLLIAGIGSLAFIFVRGLRRRRSYGFAGVLGLAALLLVVLHSAVDFSVQIPGFAISFAAFLAPVVTLCLRPARGGRDARSAG
ncbi:O-antigen ligase family protein [Rhizobiaceae bacterium BDR2-2]|uniref:O-antigen ligase family protein n=1 Tax=Ectorhizobium quercum TaxID=2965071 RepID=A0AAE3N036_9HYPH|nr:O-antigen ligase family protein [Ectorhizobium quercum]MCX8998134.1 O-antigen ligase family protein [Ectorhizobium quercum]